MSYCVACKDHTGDIDPWFDEASNGRLMRRSTCVSCGRNKCQFVSSDEMEGGNPMLVAQGISAVADALPGVIDTVKDFIQKKREREFEKNQLTGAFDRKKEKNKREAEKRFLNSKIKLFNKMKKEMVKERGVSFTDAQIWDYVNNL